MFLFYTEFTFILAISALCQGFVKFNSLVGVTSNEQQDMGIIYGIALYAFYEFCDVQYS